MTPERGQGKLIMMNRLLKGIITFSYVAGILIVIIGLLVSHSNHQNLAMALIILGAFLCFLFHFVSYKEEMKKNDDINTKVAFFRLAGILIMLGLAFLWLFWK
jgi:Na+/glutamate symporter